MLILKNPSSQLFNKKILAVNVLLVLGSTACAAADPGAEKPASPKTGEAPFLHRDYGEIEELEYRPSGVVLRLPNGNMLTFVATRDNRGEVMALAFTELRRAKNRGIASIPALAKAKPDEIFHALSRPGTVMPTFLRLAQSSATQSKPQGWARDLILSGGELEGGVGNPPLICPELGWTWSGFREDILGKGLPLSFLSEGDGPQSKPTHWQEVTSGKYRLSGGVDDVPVFYGAVLYCAKDTLDHTDTSDPRVIWRYGETGGEQWYPTWDFLRDPGDQLTFVFNAQAQNLPTNIVAKGYSVDLSIEYPEQGDKFYIGATWSKISGTLTTPQ